MCQPIQAPLYHDAPDYDIPLQCFCYAECVMHHIMTFLAMCLLCRLCDSEEVFISGFHWINRKAVRLSAIPLMSQNSRLYNLSLESLARLSLHEHIQKASERFEVQILCKHDHMIETMSNPNPSASGKAFGGN